MHKYLMIQRSLPRRSIPALLVVLALLIASFSSAQQDTPEPLYDLPNNAVPRISSTLALSSDGRLLVAANSFNDTISLVLPSSGEIIADIVVGDDPRSTALTPTATEAFVTSRADGTLTVVDIATRSVSRTFPVGILPNAVVINEAGQVFVSLQGSAEVVQVDSASGAILRRIATPPLPTGLALWGDFLYVTHLWSGQLSLIYLPLGEVVRTVTLGGDASLLHSLVINPATGQAYLPHSRSNAHNPALTYDSAVFAVVNVLDLRDMRVRREARLALESADRPVNMPFAAALDVRGTTLFVVNAGSNDLSIIDLTTGLARGHLALGSSPRGILLNRDGSTAFIHNVLDGTITSVDTRSLEVLDVLPISTSTIPVDVLIGAELFHSADDARLSANGWVSCATCHFDGQSDGRVWRGISGGRNTPVLANLAATAPYNWTGNWDEIADVEIKIRALSAGTGLLEGRLNAPLGDPHAGLSLDLDTLTAYLLTLQSPPTPPATAPEQVALGETIFTQLACATCHLPPNGVDGLQHDVGTGGTFDTPALLGLWQSAPYYHDGRAASLTEVFTLPGTHQIVGQVSREELDALIAYLLTLAGE